MPKALLLFWLFLMPIAHGQAILEPPFGLKWGDSPTKLLDWAGRHELDVQITMPGKSPELRVFRIERPAAPLPDSEARAVEARFIDGKLIEVTVHYGDPGKGAEAIEAEFNTMKRKLGVEFGPLTANQQQRKTEDRFTTRTLSFHREPVRGLFLLLAFTEVEDLLRKSRQATFSLIYRNDNLRQRIESKPAGGGSADGK
ncbi:hypothetical protein HAHE_30040 [Haloferula helveola]|uniref:Uncharacterized protein n=1 Tax=Haloferula helveola TaxID=490095 RepID=A0ABM7RBS4_9BACT|nr:hypothetical protein HAHE_30040 [Haloferula helveola]